MKRNVYEAPVTERFQIELEGGFMSGSADVENPDKDTGRIENQEINTDFNAAFDSSNWE